MRKELVSFSFCSLFLCSWEVEKVVLTWDLFALYLKCFSTRDYTILFLSESLVNIAISMKIVHVTSLGQA